MAVLANTTFILTSTFFAFVVQVLLNVVNIWTSVPLLETNQTTDNSLDILQSHPRCGITSGGREECWWKCEKELKNEDFTYFLVRENLKQANRLIK